MGVRVRMMGFYDFVEKIGYGKVGNWGVIIFVI